MPSKNRYLYDDIKQNWYKVALEADVQDLILSMDNKELQLIPSEQGSRGLRYFNDKLEYSTDDGVTWVEIQTGGVELPIEITDVTDLQDKLDDIQTTLDNKTELPISANDVTDTTSRVMITPNQRGQIDANTTDITSHSQRISTLETTIGSMITTDEMVKMDVNDVGGYLADKLDGNTLQNSNNKIVVKGLDGLTATITELNLLTGVTSNVQAQLNALTNIGNFTTSVPTYSDLANLTPNANDMVIVIDDENYPDTPSTIYIYSANGWVYSGKFEGGQLRDFTANPISLTTEVTGMLPKVNYEKQNSAETPIINSASNFTSTNVEDALNELFQYADSIKTSWASTVGLNLNKNNSAQEFTNATQALKLMFATYLTNKGVISYPYNTIEEMINKIPTIPNVTLEGTVKKLSKLNVTAPYEVRIPLDEDISVFDVTTNPIEFIQGDTGVTHYNVEFNNGDTSDFEPNNEVKFDGKLKLKTIYDIEMSNDNSWSEEGSLYYKDIDVDEWVRIDKLDVLRVVE